MKAESVFGRIVMLHHGDGDSGGGDGGMINYLGNSPGIVCLFLTTRF